MDYLIVKSLHIIFVVTWFAGLFYMPRLFVYFAEAQTKNEPARTILQDQFKIMQKRLWLGITWPSAILVLCFGGSLLKNFWPLSEHPWLMVKLAFVVGLYLYHFFLHKIYREQQTGLVTFSPLFFRVINEISTIFLVAIVFLVILRDVLSMLYGLIGLVGFIFVLLAGIKIYKIRREKSESL